SITVWYAAATANDKGRLQRIILSAEKVIGCNLPFLQDLFTSRTLRRAGKIVADPSHPGHKLFEVLPSGRRMRTIRTKTSHHKTSFFPAAVGLINKARDPHLTWTLYPTPTAQVTLTHIKLHIAHCSFTLHSCFAFCTLLSTLLFYIHCLYICIVYIVFFGSYV